MQFPNPRSRQWLERLVQFEVLALDESNIPTWKLHFVPVSLLIETDHLDLITVVLWLVHSATNSCSLAGDG